MWGETERQAEGGGVDAFTRVATEVKESGSAGEEKHKLNSCNTSASFLQNPSHLDVDSAA